MEVQDDRMRGSSHVVRHFDVGRTTTRNHPIRWSARLTIERMSKCPMGAAVGHQCDGRRADAKLSNGCRGWPPRKERHRWQQRLVSKSNGAFVGV